MHVIRISVFRVLIFLSLLLCIFYSTIFLLTTNKLRSVQVKNANLNLKFLLVGDLREAYIAQWEPTDDKGEALLFHEQDISNNDIKSTDQNTFNEGISILAENKNDINKPGISIESKPDSKVHFPRKNLIIFGHDRSGTTFLNHVFNHDPHVFNTYEPLGLTRAWHRDFQISDLTDPVMEILRSFMTCKFSGFPHSERLLQQFSSLWRIRSHSFVLISKPFCTEPGGKKSCQELNADVMDFVCSQYKHSVVKIRTFNIPTHKISKLLSILEDSPYVENKILHMVRDPRAAINSRINWGDLPDYEERHFKAWSEEICVDMHNNVLTGRELQGNRKNKYKILKYRDLFSKPLDMVQEIYDFAGFGKMTDDVVEWVINATQPSPEILKEALKNPFSPVRNSSENIDRWRAESPPERIKVIESVCQPIMELLGYKSMLITEDNAR